MAQSDQVVQNATFPAVRADINDNLAAIYSQSSGNSAPTVTVAFQPWVDTSSNPPVWKVRNGSNSAWITVGVLDPAGFNAGGITAIANGGTGATTAAAALLALLPSQSGNTGKALITDGSAAAWGTVSGITTSTAVASTSGTSIDFIGIPSTAKRVTVMFSGVSTNGNNGLLVQIGSGSPVTTGYNSAGGTFNYAAGTTGLTSSAGFCIFNNAAYTICGHMIITLVSGTTWVSSHALFSGNSGSGGGASPALSGTLDRVRITTVGGANTFDAGSINISWES
jgi:hypothetical protein